MVPSLPSLTTCSDDGKPHMILKALCKGFQEIYRFAMLRSHGKEWQLRKVTLWAASPPTAVVAVAGYVEPCGSRGGRWRPNHGSHERDHLFS